MRFKSFAEPCDSSHLLATLGVRFEFACPICGDMCSIRRDEHLAYRVDHFWCKKGHRLRLILTDDLDGFSTQEGW